MRFQFADIFLAIAFVLNVGSFELSSGPRTGSNCLPEIGWKQLQKGML